MCPGRSSTYASLGYVHALMGDACDAVEYFQKALALKRDDTFSTTMLNSVLDVYLHEAPPFPGRNARHLNANWRILGAMLIGCRLRWFDGSFRMMNVIFFSVCLNEGAPSDVPPPQTVLPTTPPPCTPSSGGGIGASGSMHRHLMASVGDRSEATSNMEMSNISMADISEEDVLAMDTPTSFYGN